MARSSATKADSAPARVVSLIASTTEIACALGCGDRLVGRSHECDFPASVTDLPVLTEARLPTDGTSYEIDERIKGIVQEALSVYRVDGDALRDLDPELILTQTQCEVCAVSERDVEAALASWTSRRPTVVSVAPDTLADVWETVRTIADALGVPERGRRLADRLVERTERVTRRARATAERPTVASIEWIDPLMAAGNWVPELVERAGGINLFGESGRHSPWMTWEELVASDPEVIVIMPCGFDIERTRAEMAVLAERPEWVGLRAVRESRVAIADGVQYFNRPGPRLVESLEILVEILHPEAVDAVHRGTGWVAA